MLKLILSASLSLGAAIIRIGHRLLMHCIDWKISTRIAWRNLDRIGTAWNIKTTNYTNVDGPSDDLINVSLINL